jgi:hypothetical protein
VNKLRFCDSGALEWMEGSSLQEGGGPPDSISNSTKVRGEKIHLFVSKH